MRASAGLTSAPPSLKHTTFLAVIATALLLLVGLPAAAQYKQSNLVSDISGMADITDSNLINPWGVTHSPTSPFWVSDAGAKVSTLYTVDGTTGAVTKASLVVNIPGPPSGVEFNGTTGFVVSNGSASGPAAFIFAGLDGRIFGWNANVPPPPPSTQATLAATGTPPAAYTGFAIGTRGTSQFIFAANPAGNRIDVYDSTFAHAVVPGTFADPNLPAGDAPFNVANISGHLYVSYTGPTGVVNVFDTDGNFIKRFATAGTLKNPWGMTVAPAGFGAFSSALLVGNFNLGNAANGPGTISAFDLSSGAFLGKLKDTKGADISIDGLWSLKFGNGAHGGISDVLYFSAGIQNQLHGLFGSLSACHGPQISGLSASPDLLWPPNHEFVPVVVGYTVSDDCDPAPKCSLSVSSSEGEGGGSGQTSPDWQVLDAHNVELRAERDGTGTGRVYTVTVQCSDTASLTSSGKVTVLVPHDLGMN